MMMMSTKIAFVTALCVATLALAGRQQQGTPGTKHWSWTSPNGRAFHSSPTSTYDTLYLGDDGGYLFAMNKDTGDSVWEFESAGHAVMTTPTVCRSCGKNGLIFWGDNDGSGNNANGGWIHANGLAEGYAMWKYITNGSVTGRPYVYRSVVLTGSYDGFVRANDINKGQLRWGFNAGAPISAGAEICDDKVVVGAWNGIVYALSPTTGAVIWKFTTGGEVTSAVTFKGSAIYVGSNDKNVYAIEASTGQLVWKATTGGPVQGRMAEHAGVVYAPSLDGNLYALDAATGLQLFVYKTNSSLVGGVTVSDGTGEIVFGDKAGTVHSIFSNGTLHWTFNTGATDTGSGIVTQPLVEDYVYVSTLGGQIYSLYLY